VSSLDGCEQSWWGFRTGPSTKKHDSKNGDIWVLMCRRSRVLVVERKQTRWQRRCSQTVGKQLSRERAAIRLLPLSHLSNRNQGKVSSKDVRKHAALKSLPPSCPLRATRFARQPHPGRFCLVEQEDYKDYVPSESGWYQN